MAIVSIPSIAAAFLLAGAFSAPQASTSNPQSPAQSAPAAGVPDSKFTSDLGFSYVYPTDWEVVDSKPMLPAIKLQAEEKGQGDAQKRGAACTQVALLVRHGNPASVIVTVALPFDCFGSKFAQSDLAGVGSGVSKGLESSFDLKEPKFGAYKSGSHNLWIERASGTAKSHPDQTYTIETVCGLLDKAMVCWLGMTKDDATLKLFEESQVTLEGDKSTALVSPDAFADVKK